MTAWRGWTTAQRVAVLVGAFTTVTGAIGLAINPDFVIGDDATAETFIVSWNGWHGLVALSVGLPGLAIAWLPRWAVPYLIYRAVTDAGAALWAALDDRPLGVLYLPTSGDAVLHLVLAVVAAGGVLLSRRAPRAPLRPA